MTITIRLSDRLEEKIRSHASTELSTMTIILTKIIEDYYSFEKQAHEFGLHHISHEIVSMYHEPEFLKEVLSGKGISQKYLDVLANYPEKFYVATVGDSKSKTVASRRTRRIEVMRVIELIMKHMNINYKKIELGQPTGDMSTVFTVSHGIGLAYSHALNFMFGEFLRIHGFTFTSDISATNMIINIEKN